VHYPFVLRGNYIFGMYWLYVSGLLLFFHGSTREAFALV